MRGRVGRRKCQTSAGSKSSAVENEGHECAFSALRQRSGVPRAEARKKQSKNPAARPRAMPTLLPTAASTADADRAALHIRRRPVCRLRTSRGSDNDFFELVLLNNHTIFLALQSSHDDTSTTSYRPAGEKRG